MKLTSVEIHPEGSTSVVILSYRDPRRENPYNVRVVEGLDADEIVARYYGGSGTQKFYNLSIEKRDIRVLVDLNPQFSTESYSDLRDALYRIIASSRTGRVQLQFKNGTSVVAAISGFIRKFESPQFSKTPQVQISIECTESMLKAMTPTAISVAGLDPAATTIVDNLSTAPHGFKFEIEFDAPVASFVMNNVGDTSWSFEVSPIGGFLAGDVLHFSSEQNDKYLYVVSGATTTYLADVIVPGSIWPILFPGDNDFEIEDGADMTWNAISHYPTYWGV